MDTKSNDDSGGSDSLDKSMQRKCVMVDASSTATEPISESDNCSRDSAALREPPPGEPKTEESSALSSADECSTALKTNSNNNSSANAAFETKVKLISQNLKETTLAETEMSASNTSNDLVDATTAGSPTHNSTGAADNRVKKVRFHPDVKENDGGNRVKKKRRSSLTAGDGDGANCDGMDIDDDEYEDNVEEDEEFNLAKTIAEAEDYLKQHPLTFVRRTGKELNGAQLREGLRNIDDLPQPTNDGTKKRHDSDDKFYSKYKPENGIERVLGKETKAGKVEFLLRYENQGGLFWESEEYIKRMCPSLLKAYEKNRERRQQRLMHHVAKRQSLRQRYTDF